jgi:uncharacterized protein involved in exopolysaccharide biosynthesis
VSLYDVLRVLWGRPWLTVLAAVLGLSAGLALSRLIPPAYTAEGLLLVGTEPRWASNGGPPSSLLQPEWHRGTERDVVASPALVAEARSRVAGGTSSPEGDAERLREIRDTLSVRSNVDSFVLQVRHRSADPEFSAALVNGIMATYVEWNEERLRSAAAGYREALVARRDRLGSTIAGVAGELERAVDGALADHEGWREVQRLEQRLGELEHLRDEIGRELAEAATTRPVTQSRIVAPAEVPRRASSGGRVLSVLIAVAVSLAVLAAILAARPGATVRGRAAEGLGS